jgi:hypothetical protein
MNRILANPSRYVKPLSVALLLLQAALASAQSSNKPCEDVTDYGKKGEVVTEAIMGDVHLVTARTSDGEFIPMSFVDADNDGDYELSIPWSDVGGIQHATLFMGDVCGSGDLPTSVVVRLWSDSASIHAMDASGVERDSAATNSPYRAQDLTVSYASGIRTVEIRGTQLLFENVCWKCESLPDPLDSCSNICSLAPGTASSLNLGTATDPAVIVAPVLPGGMGTDLIVGDTFPGVFPHCGGAVQDVFIPNTESGFVVEPATIRFDPTPSGAVVTRARVTFFGGADDVSLKAFGPGGSQISTFPGGALQVADFSLGSGIDGIDIYGAEIAIYDVCWNRDGEGPPPTEVDCVDPNDHVMANDAEEFSLGPIVLTGAKTSNGQPVLMRFSDFDGDGTAEISIPWSDVGAAEYATLHMSNACPNGLPTSVTVRLWTDHVSIHAIDSSGVEQDSATGNSPYRAQDLTVSYSGGIERIEIRGAQMALESICWECEGNSPNDPQFRRGDASSDGVFDLQDGIDILKHQFLGTVELDCDDAADADDSGVVDFTDAIHILRVLFLGGVTIPPPGFEECGVDPSNDGSSCDLPKVCEI